MDLDKLTDVFRASLEWHKEHSDCIDLTELGYYALDDMQESGALTVQELDDYRKEVYPKLDPALAHIGTL